MGYQADSHKDTSHLLVAPLVACPIDKGKPAKFTMSPPIKPRNRFASHFNHEDMTRSLPDLRGFTAKHTDGREPFKVPLLTGPLTMDHELKKLRTTGFFVRMPPLNN